jgi:hypothetical protein
MKTTIKFISATVLIRPNLPDKVFLTTDKKYPATFPKTDYDDTLCFSFKAEKGYGEEYVKKYFPEISVEIIKTGVEFGKFKS